MVALNLDITVTVNVITAKQRTVKIKIPIIGFYQKMANVILVLAFGMFKTNAQITGKHTLSCESLWQLQTEDSHVWVNEK